MKKKSKTKTSRAKYQTKTVGGLLVFIVQCLESGQLGMHDTIITGPKGQRKACISFNLHSKDHDDVMEAVSLSINS